jgi:hypothetical protein
MTYNKSNKNIWELYWLALILTKQAGNKPQMHGKTSQKKVAKSLVK